MRKQQCELVNENTSLRGMLSDAIKKGESYKTLTLDLRKSLDEAKSKYNEDRMVIHDALHLSPNSIHWNLVQIGGSVCYIGCS